MITAPSRPTPGASGLWDPERRALTVGLLLTITLVAFESLAVATVMPEVKDEIGGLGLYGWVFSGFFLASLVGIVVAGQLADRRGLALPFTIGLVLFAIGLVVGGAAQSMPMLIAGRLAQGYGAGAIPSVAYSAIGRGFPARMRPVMFATMSTAWIVPGLVGPAIASLIEHAWTWRLVFLGLVPFVLVAGVMAIPALRAVDARHRSTGEPLDRSRLVRVLALVAGVGAVLAAADVSAVVAVPLALVGLPVATWAFRVLQPPGTARLAAGVPATVAVRGILTCAFFAGDAYVSLALTDGRGYEPWVAGLALTAGAVFWSVGAWAQARLIDAWGPRRLVTTGMTTLAVGIGAMLTTMSGLPVALSIVSWGIAALGVGLSYASLSVTVLGAAPVGEEGAASAALQLSDALGIAVGTGVGGAIVAVADGRSWSVSSSTSLVFATALAVAVFGALAARRLPVEVPGNGVISPPG